MTSPPASISLTLEESLDILAALEDARDILTEGLHLAVVAQVVYGVQVLLRKLQLDSGGTNGE